jgi:hypothetical protein
MSDYSWTMKFLLRGCMAQVKCNWVAFQVIFLLYLIVAQSYELELFKEFRTSH